MYRSAALTAIAFLFVSSVAQAGRPIRAPLPGDSPAPFVRGDANTDGSEDVSDALTILLFLFQGGVEPTCMDALDVDDSGRVVLTDPIFLLRRLFLGGEPIPAPAGSCGLDPTPDRLGCGSYAPCDSDAPTFRIPPRPTDGSEDRPDRAPPTDGGVFVAAPDVTLQAWENTAIFRVDNLQGIDTEDVLAVEYWVDGEPVAYGLPELEKYDGLVILSGLGAGPHWVGARVIDEDWQTLGVSAAVWFVPENVNELLVNGGFESGPWDLTYSDVAPKAQVVENVIDSKVAYDGVRALRLGGQGEEADAKIGQVVKVPPVLTALDFSVRIRLDTEEYGSGDDLWVEFWDASTFEKIDARRIATSASQNLEPGQADLWNGWFRSEVSAATPRSEDAIPGRAAAASRSRVMSSTRGRAV